ETRALAYGSAVPLLPVLEFLRNYFGIAESDDERTARDKIAGRLLLLDDSFRDALPLLFEFLGVPDPERPPPRIDPEARQRQLLPLGPEAVGELLRDLLGEDPSLDGLAEVVRERTGGNPFFVEEVVQGLVESGSLEGGPGAYRLAHTIGELAIPATVQSVL